MTNLMDEIKSLYEISSKHSNYQNIPYIVNEKLGYKVDINEDWRGDTARYLFLKENIEFENAANVADIGANTGFFTLNFANDNKNTNFIAYEINQNHCKFISLIIDAFKMRNVSVLSKAIDYNSISNMPKYDIMLHLNILHHAGVDFDKNYVNRTDDFYDYAVKYMTLVREKCNILVFQMGYNLGGNKLNPIIPPENVLDMFNFQKDLLLNSGFKIDKLALYNKQKKKYYEANVDNLLNEINNFNIKENSEFYKRPLIIALSK